jgi:hypothetical protein
MFVTAIERAAQFTRAMHSIVRVWGSPNVIPGAATLFLVNADGWALTCGHVAKQLAAADHVRETYRRFAAERALVPPGKHRRAMQDLERKYGYTKGTTIELHNRFVDCAEGPVVIEVRLHGSVDVALLKFSHFSRLLCTSFPVFARDGSALKQGKYLCRLGFPFPEFSNFEYDAASDEIRWTTMGRPQTPRFPSEGMVTRHLADARGSVVGFELSTPGLRGQSGGPAFDAEGRVWGMQAATRHLDLDFDVDVEVLRSGQPRRVHDSAFLHVGHCVHVDVIKQFMRDHAVTFDEG